jgi:uncharacterized protein (TIGR00369 family)
MTLITIEQVNELTRERLPFTKPYAFNVLQLKHGEAKVAMPANEEILRPGGTIAGPAMMALADYAIYVAVMSAIGPVEMAVTTNLNVNFLHRPPPGELVAWAKLLKLGKRLAIASVDITARNEDSLVAHATGTYSIPPTREIQSNG